MSKYVLSILIGMMTMVIHAQELFHVDIELQVNTTINPNDNIYITGNFNKWNPKEEKYLMTPDTTTKGKYHIRLTNIPKGVLEYKFSRGSWQTLECSPKGRLKNLHDITIVENTKLTNEIEGWRDAFPASTAPEDLVIIPDFYMPQLGRSRTIRIYLPEDYQTSDKNYPVWYMQDGQDLFDEAISEGRIGPVEWEVDETIRKWNDQYIVVGIDHEYEKNLREKEYFFFPTVKNNQPEGNYYLEFIVETLKPYIDSHYRTKSDTKSTGIAGGSLGGLISLYAGLTYPEVFGVVGVFSPSIWQDEDNIVNYINTFTTKQKSLIHHQQYYFYGGGRENRNKGNGEVVQMDKDIINLLKVISKDLDLNYTLKINPRGKHGAWYWQQAFSWMIENEIVNLNNKKP
ncbi:alpha/beta hydrolase [Myroides injenensis]|uniref:alpha/beta hydrolase n=1 Tax=Myroides injenensis TaxID=1183151 RepID=UPI000288FCCC|nr:alpha/beta hydrolase-fold protein [Myroides injenensis]